MSQQAQTFVVAAGVAADTLILLRLNLDLNMIFFIPLLLSLTIPN
jgi:hypothetical protein